MKMSIRAALRALAFLCCALSASSLLAQSPATGGALEGVISAESGAVLRGVTVTVRNTLTGVARKTSSDSAGVYRAPLLPVGTYEVTAALSGFGTLRPAGLA